MITKTVFLSPLSLPIEIEFSDGAIASLEMKNNLFSAKLIGSNEEISLPVRENLIGLYEFEDEGEGHWLAVISK